MNKKNIDVIYDEAMRCGIMNLICLPVMAGFWFWHKSNVRWLFCLLSKWYCSLKQSRRYL